MKKLFTSLGISLAMALVAQTAQAADARNFKNLGFSPDGRYYAFAESVIQDGSGFATASGHVIDVARNEFVASAKFQAADESKTESEALQEVSTQLNLASYHIDGHNPGRTLWMRFPTDLSAPDLNPIFTTNYNVDAGASAAIPKYQLNLSEADFNPGGCFGEPQKLITLSLSEISGSGTPVILQKDKHLPASRDCANHYQPRQVIEYKGAIVVVLRYETSGFEGPNYNHMVVTGSAKLN